MIVKKNVPIYKISWLNHCNGGKITNFYEPESKSELIEICKFLFSNNLSFDVIGHTSNIYYLPDYNVDTMVSTRKVNNLIIRDDYIEADCGVSVKTLARKMIEEGVEGFEGLIDLPGTVAASVYNNSSCFDCSINSIVESFELMLPNGSVVSKEIDDLSISTRSTALKRGEIKGVILSVRMKKKQGNSLLLKKIADENHRTRIETQPGPKDNLGSIYYFEGEQTLLNKILHIPLRIYGKLLRLQGYREDIIVKKQRSLLFTLLFAKDLLPYVYSWNRYIWKDERSHALFWKFHNRHQMMFKFSSFEIEIKGDKNLYLL